MNYPIAKYVYSMGAMCGYRGDRFGTVESQGGGQKESRVNFASIAGLSAVGCGYLAYSAAKGVVVQLTREHAYAWAQHGIRVKAIGRCQSRSAAVVVRMPASARASRSGRSLVPRPGPGGGAICPSVMLGRVVTTSAYQLV